MYHTIPARLLIHFGIVGDPVLGSVRRSRIACMPYSIDFSKPLKYSACFFPAFRIYGGCLPLTSIARDYKQEATIHLQNRSQNPDYRISESSGEEI